MLFGEHGRSISWGFISNPVDAINSGLNSKYGGSWNRRYGYTSFNSDREALDAGMNYQDRHDSWNNTEYKSRGGSIVAFNFNKENGKMPNSIQFGLALFEFDYNNNEYSRWATNTLAICPTCPGGSSTDPPLFNYIGNQSKYPGTLIFETSLLNRGQGMTLPLVIFVGPKASSSLIKHEYGHTLQYMQLSLLNLNPITGAGYYLLGIGIPSLWSAGTDPAQHSNFWTEKWADYNSDWFFEWWDK